MSNARSPRLVLSITMGTSPSDRSCCSCGPELRPGGRVRWKGKSVWAAWRRATIGRQAAGGGGKALPWVVGAMAWFCDIRDVTLCPGAPQAAAQGAGERRELRQQSRGALHRARGRSGVSWQRMQPGTCVQGRAGEPSKRGAVIRVLLSTAPAQAPIAWPLNAVQVVCNY